MKKRYTLVLLLSLLLASTCAIAQPLPCPPLTTTWIQGIGDTTVCNGACTPISCIDSTHIRSTTSYAFSTIPYLPTAYTGGTPILVGIDDIYSAAIDIPFPFCFYGTKYNQCLIGANGEISFNLSLAGMYCPWEIDGPIPSAAELSGGGDAVLNSIMGVYQDIDPGIGGVINWAVYGTAPCRTFVVSWSQVPYFDESLCLPDTNTQQIVLYESTYAIDIFVKHKPTCSDWNSGEAILGICDATGANYNVPAAYNATVFSLDTAGFRFTPSAPANWIYKWTDHSGTVVGSSQTIVVCPPDSMTYNIEGIAWTNCDSYKVYSSVFVNVGKDPTVDNIITTNPSLCNKNDGSIVLHGLVPGISDTVYYLFNGVLQPYIAQTSDIDSDLTLTGLCQGIYDSIVVKVGACHTPPYATVLTPPPLGIGPVTLSQPSYCGLCDGKIQIYGLVAGEPYTINYVYTAASAPPVPGVFADVAAPDGSITLTNLCPGVYDNINGTLAAGTCGATCVTPNIGPYTLNVPDTPYVRLLTYTNTTRCGVCNGSITLIGVPPYSSDTISYVLDGVPQPTFVTLAQADSTIYLPNMCKGTYTGISVKFGNCIAPITNSIFIDSVTLRASFSDIVHLGCHGDTVFFNNASTSVFEGSAVYPEALYSIWSFGDGTTDSTTSPYHVFNPQGTYTITLTTDNHFCFKDTSVTIPLLHPLFDSFTLSPTIACQDSAVTFTNYSTGTPGGYIGYIWHFGDGQSDTSAAVSQTHTYPVSGSYTVQLIAHDYVPCYDTFSAVIQSDTLSGIQILATDTVICQGTVITFSGLYSALGNTGVTWYLGNGDSIKDVNPLTYAYGAAGNYTLTSIAYYRACTNVTTTRNVTVIPQPLLNLGPDTAICAGSTAIVLADNNNAGNAAATWLWSTEATTSAITVNTPGYYYATVDIHNCFAADTVWVQNSCYMNVPNVFTPNGDGNNDYFYPTQYLTKGIISIKINIYNRWGEMIYEGTAIDGRGWDGKFNNVDQPEGVYIYTIDAAFKDGQKEHHAGNITLLR